MATFDPEHLREVRNLDDVLTFLAEELDWPMGHLGLEDAVFDYTPSELGIPADQMPALSAVRQLRPLTASQPWGIFFLQFEGRKLPVTALRRLLRAVVARKRASSGTHRTWGLDDLLFFTATDSGDNVELHLIAFFDEGGSQPEVRSLPWNPDHSPRAHLQRLAWELLPNLEWPADPEEVDKWRDGWREAFKLRHGAALGNASELARRMAGTAHDLRKRMERVLGEEAGDGPVTTLLNEIREELVADVDDERFADMCAQTLVYGALTARVIDPAGFGASPVLTAVPLANPFLASFFEQVHDQVAALGLDTDALEELIADLRATNVEAILDQFGATAAGGDPVIHFYERFLAEYDSGIRAEVGAFYTPQPVVQCIVRLVDSALRERFGLENGIADDATWADVAKLTGLEVPVGVDPLDHFVSMLDPATGTGTFLVEWLRQARESWTGDNSQAAWDSYLQAALLPNMRAFELLLAPYAIAHLKVALEVGSEIAQDLAANVLLTDTLELPGPIQTLEGLDPVAREGQRAAEVKERGTPTVIVGNPPYRRVTREETGGWVANGEGDRPALMQDVIDTANERVIFSAVASLYNLYTYFWRWSIWKIFEQPGEAPGVVAFITASSWLDGPGFVGLREKARTLCSDIWVVDLGGDNRGTNPEENVFAIETPVAIVILVRAEPTGSEQPRIAYRRIHGTTPEKLAAVAHVDSPVAAPDAWSDVPSEANRSFRPSSGGDKWTAMPALADLFAWQQPGAMFSRTWPIAADPRTLIQRWETFLGAETTSDRAELFPDPRNGRKVTTKVGDRPTLASLEPGADPEPVVRLQWRAFDVQWTFEDPRLAKTESPALWQVRSDRQVFLASPASETVGAGPAVLAFTAPPDKHVFCGRGGKDILPLFRDRSGQQPNVPARLLQSLGEAVGPADNSCPVSSVEDLACYVFALLSTPGYQERFAAELTDRIVRVPISAEAELLSEGVALGRELLWLHTGAEWCRHTSGGGEHLLPDGGVEWDAEISLLPPDEGAIAYSPETQILTVADGRIRGVRREVWDFSVTGWPVVLRWLEHRTLRGRGTKRSDLDKIRPEAWHADWSEELLRLLRVLTRSIELRPAQDDLLERILRGPLIPADDLPTPTDEERKVPATIPAQHSAEELPLS